MPKPVLVRHGESTGDLENRFSGWTDGELTHAGVAQTKSAGTGVAQGNAIRALVKYLDNIADDATVGMHIPDGIALEQVLDDNPKSLRNYYLGDAESAAKAAAALATQGKAEAKNRPDLLWAIGCGLPIGVSRCILR